MESDGGVVLIGRFTMRAWTKVFMSFWLGVCILWTLGATVATLAVRDSPRFLPIAGVGMFVLGYVFVAAAKSWASGDTAWLSDFIRRVLNGAT
jgi:hypothetical protein